MANRIVRKRVSPSDVDDTPVNGATTDPISSNWAYDHAAALDAHSIVRAATLVVAASDASALSKAQADYTCDGTDDQVEIQAAIDAAGQYGTILCLGEIGRAHV